MNIFTGLSSLQQTIIIIVAAVCLLLFATFIWHISRLIIRPDLKKIEAKSAEKIQNSVNHK